MTNHFFGLDSNQRADIFCALVKRGNSKVFHMFSDIPDFFKEIPIQNRVVQIFLDAIKHGNYSFFVEKIYSRFTFESIINIDKNDRLLVLHAAVSSGVFELVKFFLISDFAKDFESTDASLQDIYVAAIEIGNKDINDLLKKYLPRPNSNEKILEAKKKSQFNRVFKMNIGDMRSI